MKRLNIVVLDAATLRGGLARPSFTHEWTEYERTETAETAERIREAHVVITNKSPINAEAIAGAEKLELIAVAATGVDIIDLPACRTANVSVCNVRRYANRSVAEHVMALILCLARGVCSHHQRVAAGEWAKSPVFSPDMGRINNIADMQLGIIGSGALGSATAALAESMGMRVFFALRDKPDDLPRLPLPQLLADSDVVSLHLPLTAETHHMFNRRTFAMMKPGALFINTARGGLVDSEALVEALTSGTLGGAGIDVLPKEPPAADEPLLSPNIPNLMITPHVAWASAQALAIFHRQLIDNIEKFYAGEPQNIVV